MRSLIDKLKETETLTREEWIALIENRTPALAEYLFEQAREVREEYYGKIFIFAGLLSSQIIVKMIVIIVGFERVIRMH